MMGEKSRKCTIKSSERVKFEYIITPKKVGFFELNKIEWMFMKIFSQFHLDLARTDIQNCYYKVSILEKTGILKAEINNPRNFYYEG